METETKDAKEILAKLAKLQADMNYIKGNMPNKEMFLDAEEKTLLEESYENEKKGLLVSAKEVRKQLGIWYLTLIKIKKQHCKIISMLILAL